MTTKRDLLVAFLRDVLQVHDANYTVTDRLRMATFNQTSRAERIAIMGENYAYAEVLYRPQQTPQGQRSAKSTSRNRHHNFDVFIWYKLDDADDYSQSSQSVWDDIVEADNGVIQELEGKPYLEDNAGNQYVLTKPTELRAHEVVLDNNPFEMAHFMNFQQTVKGN